MRRTLSLKARISICMAFMTIIIMTVISSGAYYGFRETLRDKFDTELRSNLNIIQQLFLEDPFAARTQQEAASFLSSLKKQQKLEYQLWLESNGDSSIKSNLSIDLYGSLKEQKISRPDQNGFILSNLRLHGEPYRVIWARSPVVNSHSQTVFLNIILALNSKDIHHETVEFIKVMAILGGCILWGAIGLTGWVLKWGLRPVELLADEMSRVSEKNLTEMDFEDSDTPRELLPFVKSWKEMLKRLADAMEEQKRFTSDATHELRTPIAIIKSTLQLAQTKNRSTIFYEDTITKTLEDIERLNGLIDQLLKLSYIENIKGLQEWKTINVEELIRGVIEQYEAYLHNQGFFLECKLCPVKIKGNSQQISQLFSNLIDNAIKYAPPQTTITLTVEVHNKMAVITVHDEGGKIPKEELRLIFNRFYRVNKARDRKTGGSGLGLAIAKEIAMLHSGDIVVESSPASGTSFVVSFPISEE